MDSMRSIVGLTGAVCADRRLEAAVESALAGVRDAPSPAQLLDYLAVSDGVRAARFRSELDGAPRAALGSIEAAAGLVLGVPIERGTVPGQFKHLLDLADPDRLRGKPTLILVHRHAGDGDAAVRRQAEFLAESFGLDLAHEIVVVDRAHFSTDGRLSPDADRKIVRAGRTLASAVSAILPPRTGDAHGSDLRLPGF